METTETFKNELIDLYLNRIKHALSEERVRELLSGLLYEYKQSLSPISQQNEAQGKEKLLLKVIDKYQQFTKWVTRHTPEIKESDRGLNMLNDIDWAEHKVREYEQSVDQPKEQPEKFIDYKGVRYWYEYRIAHNDEICLATNDPLKYCNGVYSYSDKDLLKSTGLRRKTVKRCLLS